MVNQIPCFSKRLHSTIMVGDELIQRKTNSEAVAISVQDPADKVEFKYCIFFMKDLYEFIGSVPMGLGNYDRCLGEDSCAYNRFITRSGD